MGFYWKDGKDQLMARSGDLPPSSKPSSSRSATLSGNPWTSFTMNLRDPSVLEGPLDLARFLVTSLSFTRSIRQVDMVMDDIPVLEVTKSVQGKERVSVRGMVDTSTKGMMKVKSVDATGMVITAKVTQWLAGMLLTLDEQSARYKLMISIRLHPSASPRSRRGHCQTDQSFCFVPHIVLFRSPDPRTHRHASAAAAATISVNRGCDASHHPTSRDPGLSGRDRR